jgi:hypothetical protein
MLVACLSLLGWTQSPRPPVRGGIGNKLHLCVGCKGPRSKNMPEMTCRFATSGFKIGNSEHRPCKSLCHISCFKAGLPFQSRSSKGGGVCLPSAIKECPHFICEACTARAVQERELSWGAADTALVLLERMCVIDMAHNWALGTHKSCQSKNRILHDFEASFRLSLLRPTLLTHPRQILKHPTDVGPRTMQPVSNALETSF